jgi:hypothetical protein
MNENNPGRKIAIEEHDLDFAPDPEEVLDYTYNDPDSEEILGNLLDKCGVKAETHPRVVDLGAGFGSLSQLMVEKFNWKPENMTCIDRYVPRKKLNNQFNWLIWDLKELYAQLSEGTELPPEIEKWRGQFDVIVAAQIPVEPPELAALVGFFLADDPDKRDVPISSNKDITVIARA